MTRPLRTHQKMVLTKCQRRGCHDWGTGPGAPAPLAVGEVQTCRDCTLTRRTGQYGRGMVYR